MKKVPSFRGSRTRSDVQRSGWPKYGTALLCSSSRSKPSLLGEEYTEFSHVLMHVLNTGLADIPQEMSLHTVADLVRDYLDATGSDAPKRKTRVLMVIACSVLTILIVAVLIFSASKIINSGSGLAHPSASRNRIPAGIIREFSIPTEGSHTTSIIQGSDGNLWFIDNANHIVRMTTTGKFTNFFVVPTANSDLSAITAGQDKKIWFAEYGGNKIGQITTGI